LRRIAAAKMSGGEIYYLPSTHSNLDIDTVIRPC